MKAIICIIFCCAISTTFAQIETIEKTTAAYDAQIEQANAEEMEWMVPHVSTTCPLMLPGIGLANNKIDIYFDTFQEESEIDGIEMKTSGTIRKVNFQIISGSYQIDYSFYYNTSGNLISHLDKDEDASYGCTLTSYYFDQKKCIELREEPFATEFCEVPAENQPEVRTKLTDLDTIRVNWILSSAAKFKTMLALYVDLMAN